MIAFARPEVLDAELCDLYHQYVAPPSSCPCCGPIEATGWEVTISGVSPAAQHCEHNQLLSIILGAIGPYLPAITGPMKLTITIKP